MFILDYIFNAETWFYFLFFNIVLWLTLSVKNGIFNSKEDFDSTISMYGMILVLSIIAPLIFTIIVVVFEALSILEDDDDENVKNTNSKIVKKSKFDKLSVKQKIEFIREHFKDTGWSFRDIRNEVDYTINKYNRICSDEYARIQHDSDKLIDIASSYVYTLISDNTLELYKNGNPKTESIEMISSTLNKLNRSLSVLIDKESLRIQVEKDELLKISLSQYNDTKQDIFKTMDILTRKGE